MLTDSQLAFVPIGGNLSLIAGAGVSIASPNTIDLLGEGVGVSPAATNDIFGTTAVFGQADGMGIGGLRPELNVTIGTTVTTGTGCTLNVALQAAVDSGTPTFLPGAWNTIVETGPIAVANLAAGVVVARFPWLPPFPANLRPRFLRLLFQVPAAASFTAGTIASALVVFVRDDAFNRQAARNYVVS